MGLEGAPVAHPRRPPRAKDQRLLRRYRSLRSRIYWRLHVDPLTPEDTAEYLRCRLTRAGCDRDVFTHDAIAMLHEAASGGVRDLDRLATGCLREAARKQSRRARPPPARLRP